MIWYFLGIIAIVLLIVNWRKQGAVWGGLIIGFFSGLILILIKGNGFSWISIGKSAIAGTIIGVLAEPLRKWGIISGTKS